MTTFTPEQEAAIEQAINTITGEKFSPYEFINASVRLASVTKRLLPSIRAMAKLEEMQIGSVVRIERFPDGFQVQTSNNTRISKQLGEAFDQTVTASIEAAYAGKET